MPPTIYSLIRAARDSYEHEQITVIDGYDFSQYETLKLVELYTNSKYLNGQEDELGRFKPFFNVVNRVLFTSTTAEGIDRKDVVLTTDDPERYVDAWLFTVENREWMRTSGFGQTLNEMTHTRGKYGGLLVKKVENGDDLKIVVEDWRTMITDPTDIASGIKIKTHFYTPSQLLKAAQERGWDMEAAKDAIAGVSLDQEQDTDEHRPTFTPYIKVYEAHGTFPKQYADDAADEYEYEERVFIVANADKVETDEQGNEREMGILLFTEVEDESPYKYLPYEKVPGRALGRGRVEAVFEGQQATNDVILKQKDILDLASKTLFVTNDQKISGNILTKKRTGDIIKVADGKQLTTLNTVPSSLQFLPPLIDQWNTQIERSTSTFAANTGEGLPSGTPFRLASLLNQEATSVFKDRQDEMGFFLEEIYRDWIIPHLKKRLKKKHKLVSEFSLDELKRIDQSYIDYAVKERVLARLFETRSLDAALETPMEQLIEEERARISQTGSRRFLDIPDGYYDDLEVKLEVRVTNEDRAKAVYLESLSSILTTVANSFDPNSGTFRVLEDKKLSRIFDQIMETSGFSPINLDMASDQGQQPMQAQAASQMQSMMPGMPQGEPQGMPPEMEQQMPPEMALQ